MPFGYPQLYDNGLNNTSQIRRSADMVYQRGGTYQITLTGDTYQASIQLVVDMYAVSYTHLTLPTNREV